MFLKALEIQGFKSFPDKTTMTFDKGITAIVGPNGSGKSNIVDAIRWVLGEQSVKTLRGGRMEDVIFGGTVKRASQSFCQVSIILDNTDHGLKTEYDEVEVTRRYYRSGESEFFINKKAVRLKDVHELFMDTGLGRDGYSIIGQGRIDEILSVKSVDRREIFEEAAGISKFRYRKEESERKLAQCEENLVRVRDIIGELENQVEPLREQAEKAKAYLIYRDELRVLEVSVWLDSLDKLKDHLEKARTDFENAERMLSAKKSEQEKLFEKSEKLAAEMNEREKHEEELRTSLRQAEEELAATDSRIAVNAATLKNNEQNIIGKLKELSEQKDRSEELKKQKEAILEKISETDRETERLRAELAEISDRIASQQSQGESLAAEMNALTEKINEEARTLAELTVKRDSLDTLKNEMASGADKALDERKQLSEKLEQEKKKASENDRLIAENEEKKASALNVIKGFELRLKVRGEKANEKEKALAAFERELNAKQDRQRILAALERDYEGFSVGVKKIMRAAERKELSGIHAPISALIETDDKYTVAIETALGGNMQDIVVETDEDGKEGINYLKRVGGRATFRPLTAVRESKRTRVDLSAERGFFGYADELVREKPLYEKLISYIIGGTAVCSDINCAVNIAKKYRYAFRIVTLDGQLINNNGSMTGGSVMSNTGILSRANELARLSSETAEGEKKLARDKAELAEIRRELEASKYETDAAQSELRTAEDALLKLNAEKSQHSILLKALSDREAELDASVSDSGSRMAELERQKKEISESMASRESGIKELLSKKEELTAKVEEGLRVNAETAEEAAAVRDKMTELKASKDAAADNISRLEQVIAMTSGDVESKKDAIAETEKLNEEIKAETALLSEKKENSEKTIEGLKKLITDSTDARLRTEGERNRCQKAANDCTEELLTLERERSRLENKKIQTENEENVILDKMWESYELTRSTAAEIKTEIKSLTAANRRISELKGSIKKLGDVNVGAIEEFARVNERYIFLSDQRDDLENAKHDLLKVIDDLTRNMKSIFAEQFKKINEEFGKTFVEIFGGGSAVLILEDESDILNCGIEIKVEMPGKSMRAISLLSGGEKAFVAIALYFAVIKVRPTPFCVLDEIEAALDDVNVIRFVNYMRGMCDMTQFIVITHRRGTMEGADILYGVTMPEHGVTKLLAININDVEEKIKVKPN